MLTLLPCCVPAQEPAPPAPAAPQSHRMPMLKKFSYTCDAGRTVTVYLRGTNARVEFDGKTHLMKQTMSGSGTRYSDGNVVWWSKGDDGFVQEDTPDGNGKILAENCHLDKASAPTTAAQPNAPGNAAITGHVTYLLRVALPPSAVLTIQLRDVSLADAPSVLIAEKQIELAGKQVPIVYELPYDAGKIDPKHTYAMSARITVDGKVRFTTTSAYPVITQGKGKTAELLLQMPPKAPVSTPAGPKN